MITQAATTERGYTFCVIEHDMDLIAGPVRPDYRAGGRYRVDAGHDGGSALATRDVLDAYLGGGEDEEEAA